MNEPDKVPSCISNIKTPIALTGVCAIHKDIEDNTYFILCSNMYFTVSNDDVSIINLVVGPHRYIGMKGIPA